MVLVSDEKKERRVRRMKDEGRMVEEEDEVLEVMA